LKKPPSCGNKRPPRKKGGKKTTGVFPTRQKCAPGKTTLEGSPNNRVKPRVPLPGGIKNPVVYKLLR